MHDAMTLRILIADDEPLARARLRTLVEELGHEVCAEAADGISAEQAVASCRPDTVLLDIEMPCGDGLSLAQRMATYFPEVPVVLVTAHAEHALAAFDASVTDYVLKPVRQERLARALKRVREVRVGTYDQAELVRVTIGRKEHLVPLNQIDCFVAEDGYVMARSARLNGFVTMRLQELEEHFGEALLRVHRSCLAVRAAVAGIETRSATDHQLLFQDGLEGVEISRRQLRAVRSRLMLEQSARTANSKSNS
jgi:two-component system, LytTR family, response regulator AlgR